MSGVCDAARARDKDRGRRKKVDLTKVYTAMLSL